MAGRGADPAGERRTVGAATGAGRPARRSARPGHRPAGSPFRHRYREQPQRTGWYALAAFFALVALGIGGFLLFNTLAGNDDAVEPAAAQLRRPPLADVDRRSHRTRPHLSRSLEEQNDNFQDGVVHKTDPVAGTVMPERRPSAVVLQPDQRRGRWSQTSPG